MPRGSKQLKVTIASGAAVSDAVNLAGWAAGMIIMPSAWTTADVGFKICGSEDGTFVKVADASNAYGTDVNIDGAAASTAYALPVNIFPAPYVKLWSNDGAGSDTNQAAEREIILFLKD